MRSNREIRAGVVAIVIGAQLAACKAVEFEPAGPADGVASKNSAPDDWEIARLVYDPFYSTPDGFYVDERASTPGSYAIHHVKDESGSYELCTDDSQQAAVWEQRDHATRAVQGEYIGMVENDRYFEVVRELAYPQSVGNVSSPTSPGYSRLFKCSYVNRDGVDRNLRDGYAGRLAVQPLTPGAVKDLVEYLWQFTFFWPARKTVIQSSVSDTGQAYVHTLSLAFAYIQGDEKCDRIELVDWIFEADRSSGQLTRQFIPIRSFEAEYANGVIRLCGSN